MRHRRRREIEEEFARNAAVSSFISGGKSPLSSSGGSFNDPRIDPAALAQRRMSDGSIADNQDYSRRILKVRPSPILSDDALISVQVTNA